jgi:hypothetical protein
MLWSRPFFLCSSQPASVVPESWPHGPFPDYTSAVLVAGYADSSTAGQFLPDLAVGRYCAPSNSTASGGNMTAGNSTAPLPPAPPPVFEPNAAASSVLFDMRIAVNGPDGNVDIDLTPLRALRLLPLQPYHLLENWRQYARPTYGARQAGCERSCRLAPGRSAHVRASSAQLHHVCLFLSLTAMFSAFVRNSGVVDLLGCDPGPASVSSYPTNQQSTRI